MVARPMAATEPDGCCCMGLFGFGVVMGMDMGRVRRCDP